MKLTLIILAAVAAVAIGATVQERRHQDSGVAYDLAGAKAGGSGYHVKANSGVVATKDGAIAQGSASAVSGKVESQSVMQSLDAYKSKDDESAREERAI